MYWEIMLPKINNFLWLQHKPNASFSHNPNGLMVDFTDLTLGAISWYWDFGDGNTSTVQNPVHTYTMEGTYEVTLFVQNSLLSWDERSITIDVLAPLPLNWTRPLIAEYRNNETVLKWSVADQVNNEKFIIEHSTDGVFFSSIGELYDFEHTLSEVQLVFKYTNPPVGINYYRIQQVDYDLQSSCSSIAAVEVEGRTSVFSFYPNPARNHISIELADDTQKWIEIYGVNGVLLKTEVVNPQGKMNLQGLSSGTYFMKIKGTHQSKSLIVQ